MDPELAAIEIDYELTIADQRAILRGSLRRVGCFVYVLLPIVGISGLVELFYRNGDHALAMLKVGLVFGIPLLLEISMRRALRKLGPEGRRVRVRASEAAVQMDRAGTKHLFPWHTIASIEWTPDWVYFQLAPSGLRCPMFPRRVVSPSAEAFFRERVATHVAPGFLKRNGGWLVLWVVLVLAFGALFQLVS